MKRMKKGVALILCIVLILCSNTTVFAATWSDYLESTYAERFKEFEALQAANKDNKVPESEIWTGNSVQPTQDADKDGLLDIYTAAQLRWALDNKKSCELMNDVDLGGRKNVNWAPVSNPGGITIEGNGYTIYNLRSVGGGKIGMIAEANNANFKMQNIRFRYSYVQNSGQYSGTAVGWMTGGTMKQVSVEDSVVRGASHTGGIVSGWTGVGDDTLKTFVVRMDQCHVRNVTTYGTSCVGSFVGPVSGYKITNCYSIDSYDISTATHSGGFVSCPGFCWVENCFTNVKLYCNSDGGVFSGIGHFVNHFENCFAAGVVEGTSNVGGFFGRDEAPADTCINCYSTSMVGMQNSASSMGGFYGKVDAATVIKNSYSAGEVGTTKTVPESAGSIGGFGGTGSSSFNNCYYDKQTSGMKEYALGGTLHNNVSNVTGYLTGQMIGDAMKEEFGTGGVWTYQSGVYPQLSVFANPSETFGNETDREIAKAYSAASVCTALLQPSNLGKTQQELADFNTTDYDTVRNISVLFPLTNDALAGYGPGSKYSISWNTREGYTCQLPGDMNGLPVITLDPKTYEVTNFAPGVGWTDVSVSTGVNNPQNNEEIVGKRFMRLVPTTVISLANASAGVDQYVYIKRDNRLPEESTKYDHRDSVIFALGSADKIDAGDIRTSEYPTDDTTFGYDENGQEVGVILPSGLNEVGGKVVVKVYKLDKATGEYVDQHIEDNEELQKLLLNERSAEEKDLGVYKLQYRWYKSGNLAGGYIVNSKTLTVREVLELSYDWSHPEYKESVTKYKDDYPYIVGQTVNGAKQPFPESPEMKGYTFMGWSTNKNANPDKFEKFTADSKLKDDTVAYGIWKINTYNVSTSKSGNGTVSDMTGFEYKETGKVTWEPDEGWHVGSIIVDGVIRDDLLTAGECIFPNIDENHSVQVRFVQDDVEGGGGEDNPQVSGKYVSIDTSKEGQGTVSGSQSVKKGGDCTVTWAPKEGWHVEKVEIDGMVVDSLKDAGEISFQDSAANHTVHVVFEPDAGTTPPTEGNTYPVKTVIVEGEGTITSTGDAPEGEDYTVSWEAAKGYKVSKVIVDGEERPDLISQDSITFEAIDGEHSVQVILKRVLPLVTDDPEDPGDNPENPDINKDTDGDGKPDINIDTDGDGKPDINIDTDGDDKPDINKDTDGDGKPDVDIDTDGDGKPDINKDTDGDGKPDVDIDTDGDGKPDINKDTDGDGKPDVDIDTDGDGKPDINKDTDGDGKPDVDIDTDGDGKPDINKDTDGDGKPDVDIDTNDDGKPDINIDTNGDGKPDINIDTDGDGIPDLNVDTDGDGKPDTNIDTDGDGKPDKNIKDPSEIDNIIKDKDKNKNDQNSGNTNKDDELPWWIPKTGDTANMLTWFAVLAAALLALTGMLARTGKKDTSK